VPEFSCAVARLLSGLADSLQEAGWGEAFTLVEVGPGEGDLLHGVLSTWQSERPDLRERATCRLVEVGEGLRARQGERLAGLRELGWRVEWLPELSAAAAGAAIVVSNELLDALPIHRVRVRGDETEEAWVVLREAGSGPALAEEWGRVSAAAREELTRLFGGLPPAQLAALARNGHIELRPAAGDYLRRVSSAFASVCLVTIDYGEWLTGPPDAREAEAALCPPSEVDQEGEAGAYPGSGARHSSSLRTYYRHQRGNDPYQAVGRQDITADVDFRALALHGREQGFECLVFTTLARLLCGLGDPPGEAEGDRVDDDTPPYSLAEDMEGAPLQALRDEGDLGGLFKVMVQVKEGPAPPDRLPS
jgi:SAM-dependent MidA family methyltransferase